MDNKAWEECEEAGLLSLVIIGWLSDDEEIISPRVGGLQQAEIWAGKKMSGRKMWSLLNLEGKVVSEADLSGGNFEILFIVGGSQDIRSYFQKILLLLSIHLILVIILQCIHILNYYVTHPKLIYKLIYM